MIEFIDLLMDKIEYPEEAKLFLHNAFEKVLANPEHVALLRSLEALYISDQPTAGLPEALEQLAQEAELPVYTAHLIFLMFCAQGLRDRYRTQGLDEAMYWDLMADLKCKLMECHTVYNTWGTFTISWFRRHFLMTLFALGRFQYEKRTFAAQKPYVHNGITVNPGDTVYNFHIPSSGAMPKELRLESYRKAFQFFTDRPKDYIVLACDTWLLYLDYKNIFPAGSNLRDFTDDFDIIQSTTRDTFDDGWRIFGTMDMSHPETLPAKTSLQRAFRDWMLKGGKAGAGYGVIIFDGQKII